MTDSPVSPALPVRTLTNLLGQTITVFRNDHVGDKVARQGLYERENLLFLLGILGKMTDPVVLDIGANVGNHTLAFATRAARVFAFEPLPAVYELLTGNIRANELANVTPVNLALSDTPGTAELFMVMSDNIGASSLDRRDDNTVSVTVSLETGDQFLTSRQVDKIDLIKLDVEAHEVFVLRGLMQTLTRDLPVITMEWNDPLTIERLHGSEVMDFLQTHYTIHVFGSHYDRDYWKKRPLGSVRRLLTKLTQPRSVRLYDFDSTRLYKNLLLIPRGREALLDGLQ